nr:hypothetical protein [Tanacetum cinerariifolium]
MMKNFTGKRMSKMGYKKSPTVLGSIFRKNGGAGGFEGAG